jgi:hypothetical protein
MLVVEVRGVVEEAFHEAIEAAEATLPVVEDESASESVPAEAAPAYPRIG